MSAAGKGLFPAACGMLRMTGRLLAMAAWLMISIACFQLWKLAGVRNPWPRLFLSGIARIAGIRIAVAGRSVAGRVLMLANHVGWIDIPALAAATGTAFVAHDGLAGVPLLKWLCELNDTIFIARHDRASIRAQIEALRAALAEKATITVFPEGTTSDGTALLPFNSSLLAALDPLPPGIAVQPVWLDYGPQVTAIAWAGEEPGVANFKRILARAERVELTIHFLEPLAPTTLANRKTMAGAAHQAIAQAMAQANGAAHATPLQKPGALP